ncbi:dehydrogenase/reductase SDR family member 7 isoform X2 [Harmonia axyridis]|uniref:dehydrogenase/reductase SDR family member 7 isoform X2 n=1 Tax=Harmonia axyridis TaxID=115357 RepID=UPI001E2772AC|nr:dehydrogenase/reductase SDR family member 7 isoform X2 [Harmonia axyridis]
MFDFIIYLIIIYILVYIIVFLLLDCDLETGFYDRFGKPIGHLRGKVVFITGASSGIGEHTAIALAKNSVKLVLVARRREELERVKRACIEASKNQLTQNDILVIPMDVTDLSLHKKNWDYAVRHFGKVDILLNNAGRSQRAVFETIDMGVDRQMFELNTFSIVNLTRIAVNYFNTVGGGHIAVVTSIAGIVGVPYSATYNGTKHAIHGYMNALRAEKTGRGLSVSIICPGPIFTNFLSESFTNTVGQKYGKNVQSTDRRMTAERCGHLCAVALANKIRESWVALPPIVLFTYFAVYFPVSYNFLLKTLGPERLFKLRDTQEFTLQETHDYQTFDKRQTVTNMVTYSKKQDRQR